MERVILLNARTWIGALPADLRACHLEDGPVQDDPPAIAPLLQIMNSKVAASERETYAHTQRVVALSLQLGQVMRLEEETLWSLYQGAYLHDIGKLYIADHLLSKPDKLTAAEFKLVQAHAELGYQITAVFPTVCPAARLVVRHHHEKWNGTGYPTGSSGEDIPFLARLFAVIDVFDALTSDRPYKRAWSVQEACRELQAQAGQHFDPRIVTTFLQMMSSRSSS